MMTTRATYARRWKRRPRALAAAMSAGVAGAVLALAACAGTSSPGGGSATGKGAVQGTISFAWWGSQTRSAKTYKIMSMFEKANPGATISGEPDGNYTEYWQKLTVQAAAKNMVCVPQMQNTYMAQYDTRGALMPLDSLVKSGAINTAGIPESIIKGGQGQDGKLYMIGTGAATTTLVYNSGMAQKYGIPPLTSNLTWPQYQQWLLAAQKKLPKGVYAADLQGGEYAIVFAWIRSHNEQVFVPASSGGYQVGFTPQTLVDFWNWWSPLIKAGAVTPPGMMSEEPATSGDYYVAQGKVLTEVDTSNVSADDASLAAINGGQETPVMFPVGPTGTSGEIMDLSGLSISANCNNVPEAAAWINYFAHNAAAAAVYSSDNGSVTVNSFLATQLSNPKLTTPVKTSLDFMKTLYTANRPVAFYPPGYNAIVPLLTTAYSNVAFGQQSPAAAASELISEANNDLSS